MISLFLAFLQGTTLRELASKSVEFEIEATCERTKNSGSVLLDKFYDC